MQTAIVIIVLIAATALACRWAYRALRRASDPCASCPGCPLKQAGGRPTAGSNPCTRQSSPCGCHVPHK